MVLVSRVDAFLAVVCCTMLLVAGRKTDPSEVKALQAIRQGLDDPVNHLKNWGSGDPCMSNWTGIHCFDEIGSDGYWHIKELLLMTKKLSGKLAPELGQLSRLEILDFMWNNLTGSIPSEIGNISSLRLLLLNGNKLSGSLPSELGKLSNLNRFQLDENSISGPIPESFALMSKLEHFHFNNNSISGPIPAKFTELKNLIHLLLDNNNLSGALPPELSSLSHLHILQLDNNFFSGEIPSSYGNFSRLVKLSLRNCSLQGPVPDFSQIKNLSYLDLSRNNLTGEIPSAKLSESVTTIDLSYNNLRGSIPDYFSELPMFQRLSLESNQLSGHLDDTIWQRKFRNESDRLEIDVRNNSLSGVKGVINPPKNVTLRLEGNPLCKNASISNANQFCGSEGNGRTSMPTTNSKDCSYTCPKDAFLERNPAIPERCSCGTPLGIGYRLKSPSFSYFNPFKSQFAEYVTNSLSLELHQVWIENHVWEEGRLRMFLKLFPMEAQGISRFNGSELQRITGIFSTWTFPGDHFFGPYELLNFTLLEPYKNGKSNTGKKGVSGGLLAAITVLIVACAVTVAAVAALLILKRHSRYRGISKRRSSSKTSLKIEGVKDFTFRELARATGNFSNSTEVGRGGYGRVYRGVLPDNTVVAIKRAEEASLQGEKEFLNEIELLSRLHHRNLVSLVGFCDEEGEQMLIYEFMSNGTLRDWLSGRATEIPGFVMRLRIALGSARGILYLHTEADPPVFHRDIKASNILLDSMLNAKVADFGLSRLAPVPDGKGFVPNYVSTVVRGTPGYLDPEYFLTHKLTEKSDVYSLGVVFLELLTGMHPISHGKNIVREVKTAFQSSMLFSVVDNRMGSYTEAIQQFAALALNCCHEKPEMRPKMSEVVKELEVILRTIPDADSSTYSDSVSMFSGESSSFPSSYNMSRDNYEMSIVAGSDLSSGVVPSINPR